MRARLSKRAGNDLIDMYLYSEQEFGAAQAERFRQELLDRFEQIAHWPAIGRTQKGVIAEVRVLFHRMYAIAYQVRTVHVLIVRVLHPNSDWSRRLANSRKVRIFALLPGT